MAVASCLALAVIGSWTLVIAGSSGVQTFILKSTDPIIRTERASFTPLVVGYFRTGDRTFLQDFSGREQRHLADVRWLLLWLAVVTFLAGLMAVALRPTMTDARWAVAALIGTGVSVSLWFEPAFIFFHELVFTNRDWYLPVDEYLLTQIYPTAFFSVAWTVIVVGSVATLGLGSLWRRRTATINA